MAKQNSADKAKRKDVRRKRRKNCAHKDICPDGKDCATCLKFKPLEQKGGCYIACFG